MRIKIVRIKDSHQDSHRRSIHLRSRGRGLFVLFITTDEASAGGGEIDVVGVKEKKPKLEVQSEAL